MVSRHILALTLLASSLALEARTFEIGENDFLLDGEPLVLRCGEVHYARIPRDYWRHRLRMLRAMGCNAVGCYMFWNFHERTEGAFTWEGRADAAAFCRLAQEEGLWVILRPGPYACAEWECGGAPWWLLKDDTISMRSSDPKWLVPAKRYLAEVGRVLAPLQVTKGGPILMVQVENEYGLHGNDAAYLRALRQATLDAGFEVPLYVCNPPRVMHNGFVPELFQAANFGGDPEQRFGILRGFQKKGPLFCSEYYPAWFDTWGQAHHPPKRDGAFFGPIDWMLARGVSFSLYMAHGGTSFGGWAGCRNPFVPNVTSYDYEAPINEQGRANPSYWKYRARVEKRLPPGEKLPEPPAPVPVKAFGTATLTREGTVPQWATPRAETFADPVFNEKLDVGFGLTVWEATLPAGVGGALTVGSIHDFGYVLVDGARVGTLDRRHRGVRPQIAPADKPRTLRIVVEAMGRINSSTGMEDRKGLSGEVRVGTTRLKDWTVSVLALDPDRQTFGPPVGTLPMDDAPAVWRGVLHVDEPADTFLDLRNWNKGIVFVNGWNLGRHWRIGPQQTLYLPGCWLKKGANEIVVVEMFAPVGAPSVASVARSVLDELHLEDDFNRVTREHVTFTGGCEVASGTFPEGDAAQVVMFKRPVTGTFFTLQALTTHDAKNLATVSELDLLDAKGNPLSSLELRIAGVDSEEEIRLDGAGENAIDGQVETVWQTSSRKLPHWLELGTSRPVEIHGFRYTPRPNAAVGRIKDWRFFARLGDPRTTMVGPISPSRPISTTMVGPISPSRPDARGELQARIDACGAAGGGRVVVAPGEHFLKGPVHLRSGVELHLSDGARLVFADDPKFYLPSVMSSWEGVECRTLSPLVYAFGCTNVAVTGRGTIAPKMDFWRTWFDRPPSHRAALRQLYDWCSFQNVPPAERDVTKLPGSNVRPHLMQFNRCQNVRLDGFKIRGSPFWTIHLFLSEDCVVRNLDVQAHGRNNDGVDIEMTRNVLIENCTFDQGDDAIVVKSGRNRDAWRLATPSENIEIRNCRVKNGHVLLGVGSEMSGGVRNVWMHDCELLSDCLNLFYCKTNERRGGFIENIRMENVKAKSVRRAVACVETDVLYQWKEFPTHEVKVTAISDLSLKNVSVESAKRLVHICGDKRRPVKNVTLENVRCAAVEKPDVVQSVENLVIR